MDPNQNPVLNNEPNISPPKNDMSTNRKKQGKHIRFKQIGFVVFILFVFFSYNIVKERPVPKQVITNNEQEVNTKSDNPFSTERTAQDKEEKEYNPITDIQSKEKVTQQNNINQELLRHRLEELKRRKEREEKAKTSSISFRGNFSASTGNTPSSQNVNYEESEQDYDSNRQASKKKFLWKEKAPSFYGKGRLIPPLSPYELKAGDFIPAIMQGAIDSDLPAKTIVALVRENVYDTITGNYLLVPQGTKIQGTYDSNVSFGQNRLLVIWQRLIFPNGKTIELDNMQGVDLSGKVGMTGKVNNHFGTLLKGVILSSIAGAAGSIVTKDEEGVLREAADGAGQQIVKIGEKYADKALSRQPTIDIKIGARFNIMVHSDLILEPYSK